MQLKPYQQKTVEFGLKHPYAILGLDPGLGKSICALQIWERDYSRPLLIVCPAYLVLNWKTEIEKWYGEEYKISMIRKGTDISVSMRKSDIVIVSYALAQKAEFLFTNRTFLILDEAQNLSSMSALRTQFIHRVVYENSIPNVYLLTGTPIKNRVQEFYSLLALCKYAPGMPSDSFLDKYPDSIIFADHFSYRESYTLQVGNRLVPVVKWSGVRNQDELKTYLKNCYIRFDSTKVLDLAPFVEKDVLISEKSDVRLLHEFEAYFEDEENSSVASNYKAEAALRKVPFTLQYVKGVLEESGSCVVFTDHVLACEALAEGLGVPAITGKMSAGARMVLATEFQALNSNVIVATIGALSTGVNLTRTNQMVFNDVSWVPANNKQAAYRIQRIGQKGQCVVAYMLGSPQDLAIRKALKAKLDVIAKIV